MKLLHLSPLVLCFAACLENEEEIEIKPDGSVHVTLSAKGDAVDLGDGYPVPLDPRWRLASKDAERWVQEIGADTGSVPVRQRAGDVFPAQEGEEHPQAQLVVERDFASVDEIPRWFAPESDVYRTANLQRSASLEIRDQGNRRVFVFERTFHGFDYARLDVSGRIELPEELEKKLTDKQPLSAEERRQTAELVAPAYEQGAEEFARDAILGIYTGGDASLAPVELPAILAEVREAARSTVSFERLMQLLDLIEVPGTKVLEEESPPVEQAGEQAFEQLETEWRTAIRSTLGAALARRGVPEPTRNAALFALEWEFSAFDHYGDLGDDKFIVKVRLPGTLVGGNFASSEANEARWEFEGTELQEKDVVIRAISVLD